MADAMTRYCLTLVCPLSVEEKLFDTLLADAGTELFTSMPIYHHGTAPGRLTSTEQVMGRSRAVQVQVLLTSEQLDRLRELLQGEFAGTGVRYWATPLAFDGEFA